MLAPLDDETVVDLQAEDENQETDSNQPLISSLPFRFKKKIIAASVVALICISGIILLVVLQFNTASIAPAPTPTITPGPATVPTIRPLPKNASDIPAESLLYMVFDKSQLDYIEIECLPQSPPTFKFMLMVEAVANFTGASNTRLHAMDAVSRQAAEDMFGLDYSHQTPVPPPPQACQIMQAAAFLE
ncbi:unnamed protein product [Orchesella dallaii]|uniref:Uncharacterized protein n=1 Tax=Orchesella dallaii TaxID=48710 RepID=A0ABP1QRN0_9HEXA